SGMCARRPAYLSASHSATVFKDTTVVNNYTTVNNNMVVNKGVGFDRVSHATRGNVRQVALKGSTDVRPPPPRRETVDRDGKTLTISPPPLSAGNSASPQSVAPGSVRPKTDRNVAHARTPGSSVT